MKVDQSVFRSHFQRSLNPVAVHYPFLLILTFALFFPSCVEKKMTVEEAKQVTISMADKPFVPPPRRVDDILAVLDQQGRSDTTVVAARKADADASPPETDDSSVLARFFYERGLKARDLSRYQQWLEDHRRALACNQKAKGAGAGGLEGRSYDILLTELAMAESIFGNFEKCFALLEESNRISAGKNSKSLERLAFFYLSAGNFEAGERTARICIRTCNKMLAHPRLNRERKDTARGIKALMQAELLEARGKFAQAESFRRVWMESRDERTRPENRKVPITAKVQLAMNLAHQGRLLEAELEIRDSLKEAIGLTGSASGETARTLSRFGDILLMQGRFEDAEKVLNGCLRMLQSGGFSADSLLIGQARRDLGAVAIARGDFSGAMKHFAVIKEKMRENTYMRATLLERNPNYVLALLKTGHIKEAMILVLRLYNSHRAYLGETHYRTAEMLAFRAMANAMAGRHGQALKDFSASLPLLLNDRSVEVNRLKSRRLMSISEAYLDLLAGIYETEQQKIFQIDVPAEIFKMTEALTGSIVQSALGSSGARAAAGDPELAELVRQEQDAANQIETLRQTLSNALAAPPDQQNPEALADLKGMIDALARARDAILDDIQNRFPKYADFVMPKATTLEAAQRLLKERESLVVIFPMTKMTFLWAIPHKGAVAFFAAPINKDMIAHRVKVLRTALDPPWGTGALGSIPELDLQTAYGLYQALLEPVREGWEGSRNLLVVAHGALGFLPLAVLPTKSVELDPEREPLFSNYRSVPWLARSHAISMLPSVTSLRILRSLPQGDPGRKAFIGFGNPYFSLAQAFSEENKAVSAPAAARRGMTIQRRGLNRVEAKQEEPLSAGIESLTPLPDTVDEMRLIAVALKADKDRDLFIGRAASEDRVKSLDLSTVKVLAFATHGLLPGELDGLTQPALALSAPAVTGGHDDGLLTMGEILGLRLNADWVVLSACNTGAGEGAGAEAVSGLGRAFFYAGTRALLVSNWPVETTSAQNLTTDLFQRQAADPNLTRADALNLAMLDMIDRRGYADADGKMIFSYAHPIFWAPFSLEGDGR
jgi:CHAT domain-containing protein